MRKITAHLLKHYRLQWSWRKDTGLKGRDFREVYYTHNSTTKIIYGVIPGNDVYYAFFAKNDDDYNIIENPIPIDTEDELVAFLNKYSQ